MSHRRSAVLLAILALVAPSASTADPPPGQPKTEKVFRDRVTVTATGETVPEDDVPAAVTIIDRRQLDDAQSEAVSDLLRRVPGLTVVRSGGAGAVTSLFTRGTESDHTLVLYDGVRLNSPYFGGFDWSVLPTAGLDRIEVVRGPFSALWGADALGGAVNLIPARGGGDAVSLVLEGGEDGWKRAEGQLSWSSERFDVTASGLIRDGRGALANSGFSLGQALLDAGYGWGPGRRIAILLQSLSSDAEIPFSGARRTPHRRQSANQTLIAAPLRWRLSGSWEIGATLSRVERNFAFRDPDDPAGFTSSDTAADTDELRLVSTHRRGAHTVSWGGEWRGDTVDNRSAFGTNLSGRTATTSGLFVQDAWRVSDVVRVLAGARWDDAGAWGSELSPRIALGVALTPGWELRTGWGRAYRQPSLGELYFPFSGNPDLAAETATSGEAGVVYRSPSGRLRAEASVFTTSLDNLIDFDFATFAFANVATASIDGAELGCAAEVAPGFVLSAQATYLDTAGDRGRPLLRRPRWSGSITASGRLAARLRGDLAVIWSGERPDVDPSTFARVQTAGFLTADAALAWRLAPRTWLTVRATNLADRTYQEVAGYPAPGRRVIAGIRLGDASE